VGPAVVRGARATAPGWWCAARPASSYPATTAKERVQTMGGYLFAIGIFVATIVCVAALIWSAEY